ncbi:OmpH family outer membrane protein [bacterium]|nr:OmpH family outer membrane protein [bacterium]
MLPRKDKKKSTRKTLATVSLLCSLLLMPLHIAIKNAEAESEYRIATIDISQVLNETSESKEAREELSEESKKAKALVEKRRKALQEREATLKEKKIAPDSPEAEKFRQEAKEFSRFVKDTEDNLKRKFLRSNTEVTKQALSAIKKYARSNNIDLVLDKGAAGRTAVLFGTPQVDITEEVIQEIRG